MSTLVQQEIYLYTQERLSIFEIGELLNINPKNVQLNLRYHKLLRQGSGYKIERLVEAFYKKQGLFVLGQKGDAPFDLIVGRDGKPNV